MLSLTLCFFATESEEHKQLLQYQLGCMRAFLPENRTSFLNFYAKELKIRQVCTWPKTEKCTIECIDGLIDQIKSDSVWEGAIRLSFVPSSVKVLKIDNCRQYSQVNTRLLPRCALHISLVNNLYFGRLYLRFLPWELEHLNVSRNKFRGLLDLTDVPYTLIYLDLSHNKFTQETLYYTHLPDALRVFAHGNRIRNARSLYPGQGDMQAKQIKLSRLGHM